MNIKRMVKGDLMNTKLMIIQLNCIIPLVLFVRPFVCLFCSVLFVRLFGVGMEVELKSETME